MKRTQFFFAMVLCLSLTGLGQETERRPMTTDDALNMVQLGDALISPDGEWVFFSKSELNWEKNKRDMKFYMISSRGGEACRYIGDEGGDSFQFSPDGCYLSFVRNIEGSDQIFIIRTNGGEAIQLTKHENSVKSYKWSEDSKKIFFVADEPYSKEEEERNQAGYNAIFVDEGPNGKTRGSWSNLWVFDIKIKKEEKITDDVFTIGDFDISPDVERIVFTAQFTNGRNDAYKSEIYVINITDKQKKRLTNNNSPESNPQWAPDGKSFIFQAPDDKEWLNRDDKFYIMNPDTQEYRLVSGRFNGSPANYVWTPDGKSILFTAIQKTNIGLIKLDIATGEYQQLTKLKGSLGVRSFSKDRTKMVYSYSNYNTPADFYVSSVNDLNPVQITNLNPWIKRDLLLADMQVIKWKSKDGLEIEGLLHLPANYKQSTKIPLILTIHGGPAGIFVDSFRTEYHVYAGLGYASLSCNVRGSRAYTDHFREGNTYAKGDGIGIGDFWDLMSGVDFVIKQGHIDKDRIGLRGWSYGGILGGWTITQTDRFKAASIGAGVYDWASEFGPGVTYDVRLWHIGGTPWDNPEGYRNQSAFTHVKNIVTPTLLIHGMNDQTCSEYQSMLLFTAIKDIGKAPVRYLRVPQESSLFDEPRHQRRAI